ncbi:MAG: hypothetical protein H6814_07540 [Phycisphaeraceae bacterium]|nr:hypothetical protein [Phycisphaeraceae bacterium]
MTPEAAPSSPKNRGAALNEVIASICGPLLLLLALWFVLGAAPTAPVPDAATPVVRAADIDPAPRFQRMTDPASTLIAGIRQRCNDCHALADLSRNTGEPLVQHANIMLNHGLNDRCLNCHDRADRSKLVGLHGGKLPYADVEQLCAQCHGPIYNDWKLGTHGKTLGYWNAGLGQPNRLVCTECHNPHAPAYEPIRPLPGPHTLRMGSPDPEVATHISEQRNPLIRWQDEEHGTAPQNSEQDYTEGGAH